MVQIRHPYLTERIRKGQDFSGQGRTEQHHKDACDINQILARYTKTGLIEHVKDHGRYYDAPDPVDFQEACNTVIAAHQLFDTLPAAVRKECDNDPAKFLEMIADKENVDWMAKHGLLKKGDELPAGASETAPVPSEGETTPSGDTPE